MIINFRTKLNVSRPYARGIAADDNLTVARQLESDRGRIINSASVRRLQQKTQVFPLERNAAVRSRLTHSLEVQQNGRYIVKSLFDKLGGDLKKYGLEGFQSSIESLVEMACLMHDIGNPPFGHFGETAISQWFASEVHSLDAFKQADNLPLSSMMLADLKQFEGNAQAIRLTFSLQQMNLTYAQSATILKYTRAAYDPKPQSGEALSYLKKKPGFYLSEKTFVDNMLEQLEIEPGHRHPFSYVMEAADDIAYCLADLEDAVEKGILSLERLTQLLETTFVASGGDLHVVDILSFQGRHNSFAQILEQAVSARTEGVVNHNNAYFVKLRINLIHHLVDHASQRFVDNLEEIHTGSFNQALLEDGSVANQIIKTFKEVGYRHVFNHQEVQELELQGHRIISGLLDFYRPVLSLNTEEFTHLLHNHGSYEGLLMKRIDHKIVKAYVMALEKQTEDWDLWDMYYRCRMLQDHVSAMTDHSALDEYRLLTAVI